MTMPECTIRALETTNREEKARIVEIVGLCYRGKGNWTNESRLVRGDRINLEKLEAEILDSTLLVATVTKGNRDEVIGCIKTGIVQKTVVGPLEEPAGYIGLFAVHPEFGSRGIGNRLMQEAEDLCRDRGASRMVLDVLSPRDDIINYYKRKGFEVVPNKSIRAKPLIESGGEKVLIDCSFILMEKELKNAE